MKTIKDCSIFSAKIIFNYKEIRLTSRLFKPSSNINIGKTPRKN